MDFTSTIRRLGWERSRRTTSVPQRVDEAKLQQAREWHAAGKYELALEFLRQIPECAEDPRCLRIAGLCNLGIGDARAAADVFFLARELSRIELARDEWNLCAALLSQNRLAEAEAAARRSVELAPDEPWSHVNLIATLRRLKEQEKLQEALVTLREKYPDIIRSPLFQERLDKDPDVIGVAELLSRPETKPE